MASDIHQAINEVMQEVGYVKKTRGAGLGYSYAGEAALIEAIRPVMVEKGIYCYVEDVSDEERSEYTTSKGTAMTNISMKVKIRFVHSPSGTSILVSSRGEGSDSGDKASNKALTGAYKYALRQTFCIETGDDPDKYSSTEQEKKTTAAEQFAAEVGANVGRPTMSIEDAKNVMCTRRDKTKARLGDMPLGDIRQLKEYYDKLLGNGPISVAQNTIHQACEVILEMEVAQ